MALVFWSDPHLGLNRTSHTTPASRKALREALFKQAKSILTGNDTYICLGDLFDTEDNEEKVIAQGAEIANRCALVLSGNHDLPNRDGRLSSLQLIGELASDSAVALDDDSDNHFRLSFPEAYVVAVPHKRTQQLFESTLKQLWENYDPTKDRPTILVLHCNYNSGYANDDATLNLTRDIAERLLDVFDYILIGHEHIARSDFDGRLQILGNIHPTSFSDISDKSIWRFDGKELQDLCVWPIQCWKSWSWEEFLGDREYDEFSSYDPQFVEINGTAPAAKMPEIAKAIQKFWAAHPETYMVRNAVKSEQLVIDAPKASKALDIPSRITEELQGSKLLARWQQYKERLA